MYSIHKMRSLKYRLRNSLNCCDCGYFEVYMVTDEVWAAAGPHWFAHCCMACLERRLKQPLRIGDFTPRSIAWPMRLWEEYPSWPRRSDARRKRGGLFPCPAKSSCGSIFRMTMIRNASGRCDAALEAGLKVRITMNIHYDRNASASKQTSMEHVRVGGWHFQVEKDLGADFKLNDHFHSRYARTIMKQYPELEGFFELRELRAERHASEH